MSSNQPSDDDMAANEIMTIDTGSAVVMLINVYEVAPEKQAEVAQLFGDATEKAMRHLPGFVFVNIHRKARWHASGKLHAVGIEGRVRTNAQEPRSAGRDEKVRCCRGEERCARPLPGELRPHEMTFVHDPVAIFDPLRPRLIRLSDAGIGLGCGGRGPGGGPSLA
jgi:hypothetical protein